MVDRETMTRNSEVILCIVLNIKIFFGKTMLLFSMNNISLKWVLIGMKQSVR